MLENSFLKTHIEVYRRFKPTNCVFICVFLIGPRYVVQIGDKIIDYNEDFRLFLSTRNPNPFIPPDAASIVTEVNFTTTRSGLRGQVCGQDMPVDTYRAVFAMNEFVKIVRIKFRIWKIGLEVKHPDPLLDLCF